MVPFSAWQPDKYALNTALAGEAKGVLPMPGGYIPWPGPVQSSAALATACLGAFTARSSDGTLTVFAGTTTKLYKFTDITAWEDVSNGAYTVPSDEFWSFAQFGQQVIAVNTNDVPQTYTLGSSTDFAALGGSPPTANIVKIVGDFVMMGGINGMPNRVQWSGRNNAAFWTAGSRDSDYQDFPDGGAVRGIAPFGMGRGLIFQEDAIRIFQATNDHMIFEFQRIEENRGLIAPASLVVSGSTAFYLSEDGFYATDGTGQSKAIGVDVVDRWFQTESETTRLSAVVGALDPVHNRVFWIFPESGNSSAIYTRCLCFDIATGNWTHADINASYIFPGAVAGYTADTIDTLLASLGYTLETAPFSFDARFLAGGSPVLAIFDDEFKLAFFTGDALAATLETADIQLTPGMRSLVRGCRPVTDATDATIAIGSKERVQGTITVGAPSTMNIYGWAPLRSSGRFHRFRMSIPAASEWTHAQGIGFDEDNPMTSMVAGAGQR